MLRDLIRSLTVAALLPVAAAAQSPDPAPTPDAPAIVAFWTTHGDSALGRLVADGLRRSPDVRGAEARLRAARAERTASAFALAPSATATGSVSRSQPSAAQVGVDARRELQLWDAGVDARWELDVFGHLQPVLAARSSLAGAATENVRDAQVTLAAEIASAYYEVHGLRRLLAVAARNAENQRRTLQLTVDRLDAGRGTAFDRERATAQLNGTLAAIPALEARIASANARLDLLVGDAPREHATSDAGTARGGVDVNDETGLAPSDTAAPRLPAVPSRDAVRAQVATRPDVRSAEQVAAAQTSLLRAARAEYLPRLGVGASVGFATSPGVALGGRGTSRYAVGPVVSWPVLDLGRIHAQASAARAESDEAHAASDRTRLAAQAEAEAARVTLDRTRARLGYLREAAAASERGAELARLRFTGGAAGFLEVLDAERSLLDAQERLAQGELDATTAFAALYRALGGVWP